VRPVGFGCARLDRQERVPGWRQDRQARATSLVSGAGGLGGEIAAGLARKGTGVVHIADAGIVDSRTSTARSSSERASTGTRPKRRAGS